MVKFIPTWIAISNNQPIKGPVCNAGSSKQIGPSGLEIVVKLIYRNEVRQYLINTLSRVS